MAMIGKATITGSGAYIGKNVVRTLTSANVIALALTAVIATSGCVAAMPSKAAVFGVPLYPGARALGATDPQVAAMTKGTASFEVSASFERVYKYYISLKPKASQRDSTAPPRGGARLDFVVRDSAKITSVLLAGDAGKTDILYTQIDK